MLFSVLIFILILIACFFATFIPQQAADILVYNSWWFRLLLAILWSCTLICVIQRLFRHIFLVRRRTAGSLSRSKEAHSGKSANPPFPLASLLFHGGVCVIALGALCSLVFSLEGTGALLPQKEIDAFFSREGRQHPLPFTMELLDTEISYHEHPLKYLVVSGENGENAAAYTFLPEKNPLRVNIQGITHEVILQEADENSCAIQYGGKTYELFESRPEREIITGGMLLYFSQIQREAAAWKSTLKLSTAEKEIITKIDGNNPVYFKGYGLYQNSAPEEKAEYTFIVVRRDWGKYVSLVGALLLCGGLFLRCFALFLKQHKETI